MFELAWSTCSNLRHLGWDPASRFQTSLDYADSIRNLHLHLPILGILDSPTWPSLRSILESVLILVFGANPLISIWINLITFCVLGILLAIVLSNELGNAHIFFPTIAISLIWILFIPPYQIYIFSGMLEIQGALFLLLSLYYINRIESYPKSFILSFFLLLQTKYPYAILFIASLVLYLPLRYNREMGLISNDLLKNYQKYLQRNAILLILPIPTLLLLLSKLDIISLSGKVPSYLIYATTILLIMHITHFLWIQRELILGVSPSIHTLVYWCLLGGTWFLAIHPDRFQSTFSTIKHDQKDGGSFFYFYQVIEDIPGYWILFLSWIFLLMISCILNFIDTNSEYSSKQKLINWIRSFKLNPYLFFGITIITFQSILTPNQQSRHIYHVYPILIVGILIAISTSIHQIFKFYSRDIRISFVSIFPIQFFVLFFVTVLTWNYKANVCYAGQKTDVRELPNFIRDTAYRQLKKDSILINDIDMNHINKPDSEIEVSILAYTRNLNLVRSQKKIKSISNKRDYNLIRISSECDPDILTRRIHEIFLEIENGAENYSVMEIPNSQGIGCWEQVDFKH